MRVKGEQLVWMCPACGQKGDWPYEHRHAINEDAWALIGKGVMYVSDPVPGEPIPPELFNRIRTYDCPAPRDLSEWVRDDRTS